MLTITNLSKTYSNGVKALNNVSLNIAPGMFGLLGPNGAGKSSLMRTIATLQDPDQGSVSFQNRDILKDPNYLRLRLGYLPQEFGVYPRTSAFNLLDYFAVLKGVSDKKQRHAQVHAVLEQTNLLHARNKSVHTFSGGMRRRFGIAQTMLADPKLIIVDEPTAGLDPEERNRFHQLLSHMGRDRVVILSTHIVEDVRELCPNMAILADGAIRACDQPERLIAALDGQIWRKAVDHHQEADYRRRFNVIATRLHAGRLMIHVQSPNQPEAGFSATPPNLEDVYFSVLSQCRS